MRRYGVLLLITLGLGFLLVLLGRLPRGGEPVSSESAPEPRVHISLELRDGVVAPDPTSVPKGTRVLLSVTNRDQGSAEITLAGYEDRLSIRVPPGETWKGEFLADRPGDDFAWLAAGKPAGRLSVTGSHLVEGHR